MNLAPREVAALEADLVTLQAYIDGGDVRAAAAILGLAPQTVKQRLQRARQRANVRTNIELALMFAARLRLP